MADFLRIEGLAKDFGGVHAVAGLDLTLRADELMTLIGPNGCGKTTLFNLITGVLRPTAGSVRLGEHDLTHLPSHRIARLGVGRKFQVPSVYDDLSVEENLDVALHAAAGRDGLSGLWRGGPPPLGRRVENLDAVRLADRRQVEAGQLSHGQKQWLEIGMVLATRPRLVLLDEPTAGMTRGETLATVELIKSLHREHGLALIVIEHDMHFVETLDCRVAVMMAGRLIADGAFADVRGLEAVRQAYLGEAHA